MTTPAPQQATGLEATQTRRPWRATLRTALAVGIPAILLLPTIIQILVDELGPALPDRYTGWLVTAGVIITAVAAAITRILALAPVELALRRLPGAAFAAQPRPKPTDPGDAGATDRATVVAIVAAVAIVLTAAYFIAGGGR
jgi:hypothetical protein